MKKSVWTARAVAAVLCALLPRADAFAQGSPSKCATTPSYAGCYPASTSFDRNSVVPLAQGDALRTASVAALLSKMIAADVSAALGFAPYSAANPAGYQTAAQVAAAVAAGGGSSVTAGVTSVAGLTGTVTSGQLQTALSLASGAYQTAPAIATAGAAGLVKPGANMTVDGTGAMAPVTVTPAVLSGNVQAGDYILIQRGTTVLYALPSQIPASLLSGSSSGGGTTSYTTTYTIAQSATSGAVGTAYPVSLTPGTGGWPGVAVSLATSSTNGGAATVGAAQTPAAGSTATVTIQVTPTAAGTVVVTPSASGMTPSPSTLSYAANAAQAGPANIYNVNMYQTPAASTAIAQSYNGYKYGSPNSAGYWFLTKVADGSAVPNSTSILAAWHTSATSSPSASSQIPGGSVPCNGYQTPGTGSGSYYSDGINVCYPAGTGPMTFYLWIKDVATGKESLWRDANGNPLSTVGTF